MRRAVATLVTGILIAGPVTGAAAHCSDEDMAPLKTAALQQELMVAALSCHAVRAYNRFVRNHQAELLDSDAALMTYFARHDGDGGSAGYNAFKTELANAASLRSAEDTDAFCYDADAEFDYVLRPASLAAIVEGDRLIVPPSYPACRAAARSTTVALADPPPAHSRAGRTTDAGATATSTTAAPSNGLVATPAPHHTLDTAP
jgi:hypothetical protein